MVMTMEMDDYGVEVAMVKIKMSLMKVEMATEKGEMAMVMVGLLWGRNKGDYRDGIREGGEGWVGAVLEVLGGGAAGVGGGEDRVTEGALEPHGPGEAGVAGEREREEER
ncbi:hypothetical protein CDL15_Pgr012060 [Punica granatum]|uniref:Uncharacterized protein n=1 Tax=Punica granatum TaxID=22663 RepID=A0A218XLZ2_PUNGR|nr:hypothetical protein CDL15_Pgr012060 [Punica granatum]